MPSLTVENYLKAILQIQMQDDAEWVSPGQLAQALNVAPGTVTSMLKTLAESRLADYRPYEGAKLSQSGRTLAMRMLRRHRLIEQFLVQTLNLTWDRVHEEAEHMEHAVSDFLVDRIDEYLGRPEFDPHGDPIPTADGEMRGDIGGAVRLTDCRAGTHVRIVRVTNQEAEFLRYLSETGLEIGTEAEIVDNNAQSGIVTTVVSGGAVPLSHATADALLVTPSRGE